MFKGSFIKRVVFSNILIFSIPFIALSLLLSVHSYNILRQNAVKNQKLSLNISENYANDKAATLYRIVADINYRRTFADIISGSSLSQYDLISSSLQTMILNYDLESVYVYFLGEQYLYSGTVSSSLSFFSNNMYDYTFLYEDSFYDYLNGIHKPLIIPASNVNRDHDDNYVTFFFPIYSGAEQNGVMIFLIDEKTLNAINENYCQHILLDKNNNIISKSSEFDHSDLSSIVSLRQENQKNGLNVEIAGEDYLMIYTDTNTYYTIFSYIMLIPTGEAFKQVLQNAALYLVIIVCLAIAGGLLIYILVRYNYKPLQALLKKSNEVITNKGVNEIDMASQTIDFLLESNQILETRIKNYSHHLMTVLLTSEHTDEEIINKSLIIERFDKPYFQVFAVQGLEFNERRDEIPLIKIEKTNIFHVDTINGYTIFIANSASKNGVHQNQIKIIIREFERLGIYHKELCLLFGKVYGTIGAISKSYFEAIVAAKYKSLCQEGPMPVVYYENIPCDYLSKINEEYNKISQEPKKPKQTAKEVLSIQNLIRYVDDRLFSYSFSLQDVADHFGIRTSYLSQYFSTCVGETINDYVTSRRIKKAQDLLINTTYSIISVSEMTGYLNENSFIRRFKQILGITPGEYRRQNARSITDK